jgi:large subunit ribosomal protein L7/L12
MSVIDLNDLVKAIEEKFGVSAAAVAAAPAAGAGAGADEAKGFLYGSPYICW